MRPLGLVDVLTAARALRAADPAERRALAVAMTAAARRADAHRLRHGRGLAAGGNGTLEAAARAHCLSAGADFAEPEFQACVITVLECVLRQAGLSAGAGDALGHCRIEA